MSGRVRGVLFELDIEQHYVNLSESNIETVYTFPLPLHAVLLGLDVSIGERHLTARALRATAAAERYEGALEEGHSAALLERAGDGLYTVSLGNLMPGERAVIRCRYTQLLELHQGRLRLCIPTVIAPRYGTASQHLRQPHQVPTTDLSVEYPFALKLTFDDFTSPAAITCPTHNVTVTATESGLSVVLTPPAWLDRDFVLLADIPPGRSLAVTARDGEGYVALLSCTLTHTPAESSRHALKLLIDCSGSMQGDSIAQARHTTQTILRGLGAQDRVSLLRFGSTLDPLTPGLVPATPTVLEQLCLRVAEMQADLGGTELPEALRALVRQPLEEGYSADVLLVTDAETWDIDAVLDAVKKSRHRLFVVAVGATPVEPLVRRLAEETGGACECVTPNEDLERAALRMAARMRQPTYRLGDIRWPQTPTWIAPLPNAVFSGDTVHVVAGFATVPQGAVTLSIQGDPGALSTPMSVEQSPITVAAVSDAEALPRIAATRRMAAMADQEAAELAERYQLVSRFTSLVLVSERDADKAQQLPTLKTVAQMPAAGWMGAGSVAKKRIASAAAAPAGAAPSALARTRLRESALLPEPPGAEHASPMVDYCRSTSPIGTMPGAVGNRPTHSPADFLARVLAELQAGGPGPQSWAELAHMGMPAELLKTVHGLLSQKISLVPSMSVLEEKELVQLWLAVLLEALEPTQYEKSAPEEWRAKVGDRRLRTLRHALRPLVQKVTATHWAQPAGHFFARRT
jgi:Ca-activated chloride channel family protein